MMRARTKKNEPQRHRDSEKKKESLTEEHEEHEGVRKSSTQRAMDKVVE
jgi:hypothetical protein